MSENGHAFPSARIFMQGLVPKHASISSLCAMPHRVCLGKLLFLSCPSPSTCYLKLISLAEGLGKIQEWALGWVYWGSG